jgi:hypothetical protein
MKRMGTIISTVFVLLLAGTTLSAYNKYQVVGGPKDFYFGHISYTETDPSGTGPSIWREGTGAPEPAVLNAPLGPGDVVRTTDNRRCEIQFDTGTIVRLDVGTELKIETVFARSLSTSKGLSNLVLSQGRVYVMYREYDSREVFQVLTANAAVKLDHRTVATIKVSTDGATDVQVKAGKASALFGPSEQDRKDKAVRKLERLIIQSDNQFQAADYIADTEFEKWNDEVNANFEEMHEGKSALPKPIQKLPDAVFYFAQKYGSFYGEWIWDSFLGYVWRPYVEQTTWQPYAVGHWTSAMGQLFWIPDEPWGWVPYHLGIWHWDQKLGWVWLPGSLFASAWTEWDFWQGYASWRPWGFFDWYGLDEMSYGMFSPYNFMSAGIWPPGNGTNYQNWWDQTRGPKRGIAVTRITKDQLRQGEVQALPIPKELKSSYKTFVAALQRKDDRAIGSMKMLAENMVVIRQSDIKSPNLKDKILSASQVRQTMTATTSPAPRGFIRNSYNDALQAFGASRPLEGRVRSTSSDPFPQSLSPGPVLRGPSGSPRPSAADVGMRFRDWNPDIRVAHRLGVSIDYSSHSNVVRCPELRFTSKEAQFGARMNSFGIWSPFGGDGGGYSGTSNSNSPGNHPGANTPNTGTPSAASHGGGEAVKK